MIKRLLHTRFRVNNMDEHVHFFRDILGLTLISRHKSPRGSELVFLKVPGSQEEIELCHFPGSGKVEVQEDLVHLAFEVDDLKKFAEYLAGKGVPLTDGPTPSSGGGMFAFIDAPDKYEIELIQRDKGLAKK
ncbi:MAG: VOC family protein [Nitrospirae bacterium]|nr:VOC family protein [Nitrospirota bacterium]MBI3604853.1 VOC family protein [Nitrospirota bacterium]